MTQKSRGMMPFIAVGRENSGIIRIYATLAADLGGLLDHLDVREVTLIGFATSSGRMPPRSTQRSWRSSASTAEAAGNRTADRTRCDVGHHRRGTGARADRPSSRHNGSPVVGCAEAAVKMVVDHADILHERVHARRTYEAVPLRLQLPGELRCLRS